MEAEIDPSTDEAEALEAMQGESVKSGEEDSQASSEESGASLAVGGDDTKQCLELNPDIQENALRMYVQRREDVRDGGPNATQELGNLMCRA